MRHILLIVLVGLGLTSGLAQNLETSIRPHNKTILNTKQGQSNYTSFHSLRKHPQAQGQLARYVSAATRKHPEYGTLAFQAPCDNCVELLDKRSETQREFLLLDKPGEVILQAANGPLHYKDAQGFWRTIDHHLQPMALGVFAAPKQPFPVQVNLNDGTVHIGRAGQPGITTSTAMRTYVYDRPTETARVANLTSLDYTAGADGVRQYRIFPNTYRELTVGRGKIKSSVVLQQPPANLPATGIWVLEETYELPDGYMAPA